MSSKPGQVIVDDNGREFVHREPPSRHVEPPRVGVVSFGAGEVVERWRTKHYYGLIRRYSSGFPIGNGPYAILSISNDDESAAHDWRDFQQLKTHLCGPEWEAVELYPAESRLVDPSNRFYLWCVPKGVIPWGLPAEIGRQILHPHEAPAPQRPFPKEHRR